MTPPTAALARGTPWYLRAGAWIGIGTSPGALITGAGLADGRSLTETAAVLVLGSGFVALLSVAQGLVSRRHRAATIQLAQQTFGAPAGPAAVAALVVVGVVCWTGFYIGLVAGALGDLLGTGPMAPAGVLAGAFWVVYRSGFRQWNALVAVTGVAALAVSVLILAGTPGADVVAPTRPLAAGSLVTGVGVVVAYGAVFTVRAADFTFDAARRRDVWLPGAALFTSLAAFLALGAAIARRSLSTDIGALVAGSATPELGVALLLLSILAPSVSGLHSGALGLGSLSRLPPVPGAGAVAAAAAVLGAARFDRLLLPFLVVLGAVVPPIAAVLIIQSRRRRGWHAWTAWGTGSAVALAALAIGLPVAVLLGVATAAVVMVALPAVVPDRAHAPTESR